MAELKFDVAIEKNLSGYSEGVVSSASRGNSKLTTERAMLVGRVQALQEQLFHAIRGKIVAHLWPLGGKLPSTRKMAGNSP